jgi:hypothetical protein
MVYFNAAVSLILAIGGLIMASRGQPVGFVLLGCVVVHWIFYFQRNKADPKP